MWLYDHGLGRLLGRRFLCLTHIGRRSGRTYRTVLEVIVGTDRFTPEARVLTEADAVRAIADYEHRNRWIGPLLRPLLGKLLGRPYDGSDTARHRMARQLPIVALRPHRS